MKTKGDNKYAIVVTASKIAVIYYKMVRFKQEFIPVDVKEYRLKYNQIKIFYLERKLAQLKAQAA